MTKSDTDARSDYAQSHYLLFGNDEAPEEWGVDAQAAHDYLGGLGFGENSLAKARKHRTESQVYGDYLEPGVHRCDFCGRILRGAEYDRLKDGRERCLECSQTVVKAVPDYEVLFGRVRENLCTQFHIDISVPITIKVVSQRRISKITGTRFQPTSGFDPRPIGVAVQKRHEYRMYFENGSPRASLTATSAHELTHIWQYTHWDLAAIKRRYGDLYLPVCEGMAKWVEIQYMYLLNESAYADRMFSEEIMRDDEYGYGLRLYVNEYPLSHGTILLGPTPFMNPSDPLNSETTERTTES